MDSPDLLLEVKNLEKLQRLSLGASDIARVNGLRLAIYSHSPERFKAISRRSLTSTDLQSLLTDLLYEIYSNRLKYGILRPILKDLIEKGALEGDLEELYFFVDHYQIPRGLLYV